jgi:hypothetical protein
LATVDEHPEKYGWWINELESLGITETNRSDKLDNTNDSRAELEDLAKNTKEILYESYKSAYVKDIEQDLEGSL